MMKKIFSLIMALLIIHTQTACTETLRSADQPVISMLSENAAELQGDVNADGNFDIQDIIMVQDWLLTKPGAALTNWRAADVCQDEKIDVFDLCLLKRMLLSSVPENPALPSDMHDPPGGIEWKGVESIAHPQKEDRTRYSYSKLCNLYFTYKLHDVLSEQGLSVTVNAFNPGFMAVTNFTGGRMDKARAMFVKATMPDRFGDLESSSDALAQIAANKQFSAVSGQYFDRSTNTKRSSELSYNMENREELWRKSLAYCDINE